MNIEEACEIIQQINNVEWDGNGDPLYSHDQMIGAIMKVAKNNEKEITLLRENAIAENEANKILSRMPDKELMKEMAEALEAIATIKIGNMSDAYKQAHILTTAYANVALTKYNSLTNKVKE